MRGPTRRRGDAATRVLMPGTTERIFRPLVPTPDAMPPTSRSLRASSLLRGASTRALGMLVTIPTAVADAAVPSPTRDPR